MYDETPYPPPWNDTPIDERLTLRIDDEWFALERAEHDGRMWSEGRETISWRDPTYIQANRAPGREYSEYCSYCCTSARLEKTTSIEGPIEEIADLKAAIKTWTYDRGKRWGFYPLTEDVGLVWSPRNSEMSTRVTRRALEALVAEQEAQCT